MTTILASMKHRVMVADSNVSGGGPAFKGRKIFEVDGKLVGIAGHLMHALKFVRWLKHGTDMSLHYDEKACTFDALVMDGDTIYYYDNELIPVIVEDEITAIGSGSAFAIGAIDAGASPRQAVEIACERDEGSKGPVIVMRHKI
jgi:ATP-dependent protease HslVU (ClpYQ) peptidase subunit